ncbi:hypothetical protein J6590_077973 [Homalodisca vitripennis]|nr:hypothetical protein J6590_077973 [Homalodisca vitripennis]
MSCSAVPQYLTFPDACGMWCSERLLCALATILPPSLLPRPHSPRELPHQLGSEFLQRFILVMMFDVPRLRCLPGAKHSLSAVMMYDCLGLLH